MYRKIELSYNLDKKKKILTIYYVEENKQHLKNIVKEYDTSKYDDEMVLYNQVLDDLDAEYDDNLAELIDRLIKKAVKENE